MRQIKDKLYASPGTQLMRKADGSLLGDSVSLGYIYQTNGVKLDAPHKEIASDFYEVRPMKFDGDTLYISIDFTIDELVDYLIRLKYSVSQEFSVLRQQDRKGDEFKLYDDYCELCKKEARNFINTPYEKE